MTMIKSEMYTWACDIPDCKEKLTAGGDHLYAIKSGWGQFLIDTPGITGDRPNCMNKFFHMCPSHTRHFSIFLTGREYPNEHYSASNNSSV